MDQSYKIISHLEIKNRKSDFISINILMSGLLYKIH